MGRLATVNRARLFVNCLDIAISRSVGSALPTRVICDGMNVQAAQDTRHLTFEKQGWGSLTWMGAANPEPLLVNYCPRHRQGRCNDGGVVPQGPQVRTASRHDAASGIELCP